MIPHNVYISSDLNKILVEIHPSWANEKRQMILNMSLPQYYNARREYNNGAKIQEAFHMLSDEEREFLLTGTLQREWDEMYLEHEEW